MKSRKYTLLLLIIMTLLTLCPYSHKVNSIIIDIFSHFQIQYALISLILSGFFFFKKRVIFSLFFGILFLVNFSPLLKADQNVHAHVEYEKTFKVYSANINRGNKNVSFLIKDIVRVNPDIVFLMEVQTEQIEQLAHLIKSYNYKIIDSRITNSGTGVLFLSNFPVINYNLINLSDHGNAFLETQLFVNQKRVLFYGVHIPRLHLKRTFSVRQKMILRVAEIISVKRSPVIVAGDFNATPFSPVFRKFLKISGLKDSRNGFGWQPTWPSFFPFLWIPIDHILVSPDVKVQHRETGYFIWSDHFPVIAELSLS